LEDAKEELEEAQSEKKESSNGTSGNASKSKDTEYAEPLAVDLCPANPPKVK